jgi:tripartite-type tricarboxylate transporter receptor subunit TctC
MPRTPHFHLTRRSTVSGLLALSTSCVLPARAQQTFPSRPVRIIPFGTAGGPIDTISRLYAEKLRQRWSQPLIVDPKPGASGIIAADAVAKSAPDGYTVMLTMPLSHMNQPILHAKIPYDPFKDFQPVSILGTGGPVLVARADAPFNDLKSLIAFARKQVKGLTYGTWGNGSTAHLYGDLLMKETSVSLIHVAYKGESSAHSDVFGGALDFAWANAATAIGHINGRKMKALGVASSTRLSILPDVPTFEEQGFPGFDIDTWVGVFAPAATPRDVIAAWESALREITQQPDIAKKLLDFGFQPAGSTSTEFQHRFRADYPRMAKLIRAAGVVAE